MVFRRFVVVVAVFAVGACGSENASSGDSGDDELSLVAGACVDASDEQDIVVVRCVDDRATAQVLGSFAEGRCPPGSFGIESVQTLNGRELPDLPNQSCAKDIEDITSEDLARIDSILNPKHFDLPIIGSAVPFADGPDVEVGGCLSEGRESPNGPSAPLVYSPVACDDDDAVWEILSATPQTDPCPAPASAVVTEFRNPNPLCVAEIG